MKIFRLILILLVGGYLTYLTYSFQFRTFFGDAIIWLLLIGIGILLFIWTIIKDYQQFKAKKRVLNFTLTSLCLIFVFSILLLEFKIQRNFNKPTLIKVFYDGDYNGTSIDFKKDGTYIFDNSAIGLSDYTYGTYEINGNNIKLDRDQIDNLTNLKQLKIDEKEIDYKDGTKKELYLFQVDTNGNIIDRTTEYRVTIDNRK
jgi:glucan phosphoethanolaminetransferase (alkaline phosphatase superfamily)